MTAPAYPTVTFCARCDALEQAHEIRGDGTRGRRYGQTAAAPSNVACPGFQPGRTEERPPEGELRRRLAAVLALPLADPALPCGVDAGLDRLAYATGYHDATARAQAAARGET